jgi:6-phosphogluconate dehydrogenase
MELSIMQPYAEVFHIAKNARSEALPQAERCNLDIADIAEALRRGRVITAWLLDVAACARANDPSLDACSGVIAAPGKRRWTGQAAIDDAVAVDVLAATLFSGILSPRFAEKIEP